MAQTSSTGKVIIKTALISTGVVLLSFVLIAVLIFFCFPKSGYEFCADLGMKKSALYFADRLERGGNIEGLVYCVELDDALMQQNNDTKYAEKLISHTQKFFEYENWEEYFAGIDEYSVKTLDKQFHIGLYSYYCYVVSENYKARDVLGSYNEMIFDGKPTPVTDLFSGELTPFQTAVIYTATYNTSLKALKNVATPGFSDFYYDIKESIPRFIVSIGKETDTLKSLFLMRSAIYLINDVVSMLKNDQLDSAEWENMLSYPVNGVPLKEIYATQLVKYISDNQED